MRIPSVRTLSTVALAARAPRCVRRRAFHASAAVLSNGGNEGNGAKPTTAAAGDESAVEQNDDVDIHIGIETSGGRSRGHITGSSRARQIRKRPVSALPPVRLPQSFLDNNVSLHGDARQPRLPTALEEDGRNKKVSQLFAEQGPSAQQTYSTLEKYFETALSRLLLRDYDLTIDFLDSKLGKSQTDWTSPEPIEEVVRTGYMILDSAWHLADALYPARQAEYTYKVRPFWWWHIYKDLDIRTQKFRDLFLSLSTTLDDHFNYGQKLDLPLSHTLADLSIDTFIAMQKSIGRDLLATPPTNFDEKTSKRPITILSLSGYNGKAIAQSIAEHFAYFSQADIIRLDSYDFSEVVGDYIGQNWAHSRGALSNLGFRCAELNGKAVGSQDAAARPAEDEDPDIESGIVGVRTSSATLEEELQKIKQGGIECFSKWENLKIDKMLDHIIRSVEAKTSQTSSRPVLIHVHDFVELNMTLEGSYIIARLRALVDAAWQQGMKVALLGTSSCEQPSEEYQTTIRDLSFGDFVVTRHIRPDRADPQSYPKSRPAFSLQKTDMFVENITNISRMLRAMGSETSEEVFQLKAQPMRAILISPNPRFAVLRESILSVPEVYHMASAFRVLEKEAPGLGPTGFVERFTMGPLRQKPGEDFLDEQVVEDGPEVSDTTKTTEEAQKAEARAMLKLNEYEKRIATGQINKESLKTTFADVHVPPETTLALKLLTSLALVRPDAFAYGVLAADKIPGCLLYGPPGTGKTMLAKAVAKESGANMLEISGASINDKWVGESEKLIRAVFTLAKKLSPCVVFIDEADSLLANRSMFSNRASHREHINQFLKEWDGMEETNAFIMVATNRPFDLDDAVLRRLPRKILVDLPLQTDRLAILRLLLKEETLDDSVSLEEYAKRTPFYSGSDLKNMCVAAAMAAVEEENKAASEHAGPEPFQYPERRVLRATHFEQGLKQIPASINEDMISLKMIRKFDEEYGSRSGKGAKRAGMGFGIVDEKTHADVGEARVRPPPA